MARKDNSNNPLQLRVKALAVPRGVTPRKYLSTLIRAIDTGEDLPRGWSVELHWRNPNTIGGKTKRWRSDDFVDACADSRPGFNMIVRDLLSRQLRKYR